MKMLQIRNLPDELHRKLKARAALEGQSMSDYAQAELRRALERPTRQELIERVRARRSATVTTSSVDAVRAERDAR
jgi:plasmid stability protein